MLKELLSATVPFYSSLLEVNSSLLEVNSSLLESNGSLSEETTITPQKSPLDSLVKQMVDESSKHLFVLARSMRNLESLVVRYTVLVATYLQLKREKTEGGPFQEALHDSFEGLKGLIVEKLKGGSPAEPYRVERNMLDELFSTGPPPES